MQVQTNHSNFEVIVFLQGIKSKEVYQVAYQSLAALTFNDEHKMATKPSINKLQLCKLIPNPSTGEAKVVINQMQFAPIYWEILANTGSKILSGVSKENKFELPLDQLNNGTYIVKIRSNQKTWVERLVLLRK